MVLSSLVMTRTLFWVGDVLVSFKHESVWARVMYMSIVNMFSSFPKNNLLLRVQIQAQTNVSTETIWSALFTKPKNKKHFRCLFLAEISAWGWQGWSVYWRLWWSHARCLPKPLYQCPQLGKGRENRTKVM